MSEESNGTVIPITDATPLTALQGGRPIKFTPERMEQIKNLVERGMSREEIAETIGVTLGSHIGLRLACSKALERFLALMGRRLARASEPNAARLGTLAALARPGADQLPLELGQKPPPARGREQKS